MKGLKRARLERDMSVSEVSKIIGVSDKWLYMCEQGKRVPNVKRLQQLASLYEKTIDELLREEIE